MVRVNYRGSNIGEGEFREIQIADNSEQVAKRNDRYIDDLKKARDAQTQIDSAYIREYETALRRGEISQDQENKRQIAAAQTIANQQIKSLQAQAKEIESITGRRANITGKDDKQVDSWLEFVTKTSTKAADIYKGVQEKKAAFQWDQGIAKAHMFGATWEDVAWKRRWDDAGIIGASKDQLAAIAEANGADPSYVEQIREGNTHFLNATKHALATDMLKVSTSVFETALNSDADTIVDIRQPDGTTKKVPLNEIDRGDVVQVQQAYYQWLPQHIKENGFGDASPEFLNDGLQKAKQGYDTLIGQIRQNEIQRNKTERIQGAEKVLQTEKTPIAFKGAVIAYQNETPTMTSNAAHEKVIGKLGDIISYPDQAEIDNLLDNTIVAGGATLRQAYPSAVQNMLDARVAALNERYTKNEAARQVQEEGEIDALVQSVEQDRADDGQVNQINNEQLEEQAVKAEQEGKTALAAKLRELQTQTVDGIRQQQLIQSWDEILADGGVITPQMVIASGVDDKTQATYIKKANESIETAVPDASLKFFQSIAEKELKNRAGRDYKKDSIGDTSVDYAARAAVEMYKKDYAVKFKETGNRAQADQYAQDRFFQELKNEKGRYEVAPLTTGAQPYPNFLPKGTQPVDDITSSFERKYKDQGGSVYREPHEDLRPSIESSLKSLKYSGKFVYPPAINKLAEMSSGAYSSLDVMRMQAEALGIELPPSFQQAQQVEAEIGPAYQKFLKYKPSTTRTDIALIGAGQEPVYTQAQPAQRAALDAIARSESGANGYDAVNQGGEAGGTRIPAGFYSGAFSKMNQHRGRRLTDLTVGEVMALQAEEPISDQEWVAKGKLHAVGRYQFIGTTLKALINEHGVPMNAKFSAKLQDYLALSLLNQYGDGQWVGPSGADRDIIRAGRGIQLGPSPWQNTINMNPAVVKHIAAKGVGQ